MSPNAQMMEASGETSGVGSHAMLPTVVDGSAPRGGDVCQSAGGLSSVASCESIGSCTDSFVMVPEGYEEGTGKKGLRGEAVDAMRSISFAAGKKGAAAKAALAKKKAAVAAEARSNYKAGKVAVKAGIAAAKEQAAGDLPPLPSENRDMRGRSRSTGKTNGRRSVAAVEGIMLLKKGSTAVKYSRKGKPRSATFKLSKDEAVLSWTGARAAGLMGSGRSVVLADVVELVIGNRTRRAPALRHALVRALRSEPRSLISRAELAPPPAPPPPRPNQHPGAARALTTRSVTRCCDSPLNLQSRASSNGASNGRPRKPTPSR